MTAVHGPAGTAWLSPGKEAVQRAAGAATARGFALVAAAALAAPAVAAPPNAGRYEGELCVALAAAATTCGRADLELGRRGVLSVRISDIVYRLQLHARDVDVLLTQGAAQIDAFTTHYEWAGRALRFADPEKSVRYEVRFERARQGIGR